MSKQQIQIDVDPDRLRNLKLDGRGRVTIPKDFRDRFELEKGDRLEIALVDVETDGYTCEGCGRTYELPEVLVLDRDGDDERIVCGSCMTPEDRIID
ncbi:AbrB/MazE/SpoVT family DNA-binding domain-containing protein [Halomontanus rarus]|uniref:AbrB/MazE/SpoVT family DNA-binding domain-containing protein n=1 Tax=Halomontanus rarus TaxID=3034020 RepID=UPI00307C9825